MTLSILGLFATFSMTAFSITTIRKAALSVAFFNCYTECHYVECRYAEFPMPSVIMLGVVSVIMLNVIMLTVALINVVAPYS
jgi:hypothetical protein